MPSFVFVGTSATKEDLFKFERFGEKADLSEESARAAIVDDRIPLLPEAQFAALKLTDQQVKDFYLNDDNIEQKRAVWLAAAAYRDSMVDPKPKVQPIRKSSEES